MMDNLSEIPLAEPEQGRTVEFRVAANVVVGVRMERLPVLVTPRLFGVVFRLDIDRTRVPVIFFAPDIVATLEQQNLLARGRKLVRERAAAGAGADDDDVVMRHAGFS